MAAKALGVTWAMKLYSLAIHQHMIAQKVYHKQFTNKLEIHDEELVIAVLFARVRVEKISAGYAHESGPIHALKKKLKTQVLSYKQEVSVVRSQEKAQKSLSRTLLFKRRPFGEAVITSGVMIIAY